MTGSAAIRTRQAYLFAVLVLGGASAAGLGANALLQLLGAAMIAWTLGSAAPGPLLAEAGLRRVLVALAIMAAVQFLPLPAMLWQLLPGRGAIAEGYALAGIAPPWLTLSLDPWATLQSLVWWVPALALLLAASKDAFGGSRRIINVIALVGYVSVGLAVIQKLGGSGYFYAITNRGNGVGLFANSNHFGSFMLIALALVAGQWIQDRPSTIRTTPALASGWALLARLAPFALGVFLSNSLACAILLGPVAGAIYLIFKPKIAINWYLVMVGLPLFAIGLVWLLSSGLVSNDLMAKTGTAGISRGEFLENGLAMAQAFAPTGSGLGTFRALYPWFEQLDRVSTTFVNHAHNDLLELVIETGLFGIGLVALLLAWLGARLRKLWTGERDGAAVALAASVAVCAVLIHSLADYPLRTAAISSLVAVCLALMTLDPQPGQAGSARQKPGKDREQLRI